METYSHLYPNKQTEVAAQLDVLAVVRQINRCPKLQIKTDFLEPAIT